MESRSDWSPRETVIVVMDANKNKVGMDALDWALKHVVHPRDTVVVLGVLYEIEKKSTSCFPLNMGISINAIYVATLTPSRASRPESPVGNRPENRQSEEPDAPQEGNSSLLSPPPQSPRRYPLQWRNGFPREFSLAEFEEITNGFADENFVGEQENFKVCEGIFMETPVLVKSFLENDERFWSLLKILLRVRHRNIMNLVGYCFTGTSRFLIFDYPYLGTLELILQNDNMASNLPWKARWYTALEVGGSLRCLHEECPDGPIAHLSVSSSNIVFSHGCSAMLSHFQTAMRLNDETSCNGHSTIGYPDTEEDESLSVDVHDYGMFLVELINGKGSCCFPYERNCQTLIQWALPLLKNGSLTEVMYPRLSDPSDTQAVHHMAQAALLCLNDDSSHRFTMSEVLAVVRGDQLPMSSY
ncbi:hypothetical protein SLEP1_g50216 [Rubroshorea leprosula]|uniref:Protein kinase domain-containing protein n=1 Tax=Rubroshorea leprosula TaxID=152421 RepID=A0AAV5M063_9ROSI|nr:hypothetical protein SLEP1_g50216 [Rubroshorea leprosula]